MSNVSNITPELLLYTLVWSQWEPKVSFLNPPGWKGKPLTTFSVGKNDKFLFQGKRKEMKKKKKKSTNEGFRPSFVEINDNKK